MDSTKLSCDKVSLLQLASIRRSVWDSKASHPRLIHMEMVAHQSACQEYSIEILKHLIDLENQTRSSWTSFQSQPELTVEMRTLIFDFIMSCHTRLGLSSSTLFLCYNIIDRYCSKIIVKSPTYQLLGLTALWLASKFADKKPRIPSLQSLCCHQHTKQQFKEMELHILKSLNWSVCSAPSHDSFVDILLKTKIANLSFKRLNLNDLKYGATILCELSCFDPALNYNYNSSAIALASVTVITCALRLAELSEFIDCRRCTTDKNLIVICNQLLCLLACEDNFPSSFNLKYASEGGTLHSNPIMARLFAYYRRLADEKKRSWRDAGTRVGSPCAGSAPASAAGGSPDIRIGGDTPPGSVPPSALGPLAPHMPTIKTFVPPTPTTPSNSSRTQLSLCAKPHTLPAPVSVAASARAKGTAHQHTPPVQNPAHLLHTAQSKRAASAMDLEFFDMDHALVKKLR
ncbi:ADR384Wp [Eremothecium gossypii ATCC 10895]|uniref:ADR384Wp n=1 Tax=Eremothecium gossypii (strain ATCC 10895 / CBS 109.51 / FGSC 9923 / NRRL Y-1056) TaxID=284811 RepID=Q758Z3_EREGS|nr:ADR384Wp [Eremothecium gossypii ATCC 10895]AAS52304.2 ADR384Wp [Eremothecium gossypii ATCC 10895]AEY96601.1 FADR384Wp [Eremothecium gossypii FDAG1]